MGLITVSQVSDGDTAEASDINDPINTIANEFNGNIDNDNIKSAAAIATSKLATDAGIKYGMIGTDSSWAWSSWTPTWANLTIGNATVVAKYIQIGKVVEVYLMVTFGSSTSVTGSGPTFTLPVTASSDYSTAISSTQAFAPAGTGTLYHSGVYHSPIGLASTTTARFYAINYTTALYVSVTSTVPATWASGDVWIARFTYEAA